MKKSIFYSLSVLLAFALVFTSCNKEDDYDFNNYTPVIVGGVTGPNSGFASGLAPLTYKVVYRGGSDYAWTVTGIGATIVKGALPSIANITFAQSNVDVTATITVVETTQGGKVSEPVTYTVALKKFKAMAITEFYGTWTGTEKGAPITLTAVAGPNATSITFKASGGLPALMKPLFQGWGETFQPGFAPNGDITVDLNLNTGDASIKHYWGQTLPGPYDYWISGTGLWSGVDKSITLDYVLHWAPGYATNYNPSKLIITKAP
jgi:hypothetical protein